MGRERLLDEGAELGPLDEPAAAEEAGERMKHLGQSYNMILQ